MAQNYNICLDIGGTKILGAIFDEKDEIIYRLKKKTKQSGDDSANVEKVIVSVVEEMIEAAGIDKKKINAIAAGAPGVINQDTGVVLFSPNLPWRNYNIKKSIEEKTGIKFFIGNHGRRPDPGRQAFHRQSVQGRGVRPHDPGSGRTLMQLRPERMP